MKLKIIAVGILCLALSACAPAAPITPAATETPAVTATSTKRPTNTPSPTPDRTATRQAAMDAVATREMEFVTDTVLPDLELAGFTLDSGSLGYQMLSPIYSTALLPGYRYHEYLNPDNNPVFRDFVLGVDVKWSSETGVAGCSILFRGDGDFGEGEFVEFGTLRLSGLPYWAFTLLKFNQVQGRLNNGYSEAIDQSDGGTNHYVIAVQGADFSVYANGVRLGNGTMRSDMVEGEIAFQTWQESGQSTCAFDNAWVWELNED